MKNEQSQKQDLFTEITKKYSSFSYKSIKPNISQLYLSIFTLLYFRNKNSHK